MFRIAAISVLLAAALSGQTISKGFEHFYNLEFDAALREFQAQAARDPKDPNALNHIAQGVLYREMFKGGALESELVSGTNPFLRRERVKPTEEAVAMFEQAIGKSMAFSQERLKANPDDTKAMYSLGVAHGLRANWNFLVRKAWKDALRDATEARKLHNRVVELDPNFIDAKLIEGVHDYVVGSLPWHWKVLGFIAGFRGDREGGLRTLQEVAQKGTLNKYDAKVLLAAVYRRERKPVESLPLLKELSARFPRNYLYRLEAVQMYSDIGEKTSALAILEDVEKKKNAGAPGYASLPYEKIWYYRGNLLFWYRDFDGAIEQLRRVTPKASTIDLNTALMTWMRLGQSLDMKGRREEAKQAYKQAIAAAPESAVARESQGYLNSPYRRNKG